MCLFCLEIKRTHLFMIGVQLNNTSYPQVDSEKKISSEAAAKITKNWSEMKVLAEILLCVEVSEEFNGKNLSLTVSIQV